MKNSAYFTLSLVLLIISVIMLVLAVIFDGMNNINRSVVFGCVSCACAVPAFTSATIFLNLADEDGDEQKENAAEGKDE